MSKNTLAFLLLAVCSAAPAAAQLQAAPIEIYVTPFYNSEGPQVSVGKFSRELATVGKQSVRKVAEAMRHESGSLPVVAMYVVAIRLYDLGHRDEAVRWFYAAQYRAHLFQQVLDPRRTGGMGSPAFELHSAHNAFQQLAGSYINGYAGCDRDKWLAVLQRTQGENKSPPDLASIYPGISFIPATQWAGKNAQVANGLTEMAEYLKANWSELKAGRAQNNMDGNFCGQ